MAPPKAISKRKLNEKELKDVTKYLRRRLEWCRQTGQVYDPEEQYSIYPRALCDSRGIPHTGTKSVWLAKLASRYTLPIIQEQLPDSWVPEAVIVDAMFILATKPMRRTATILHYSEFLFNRFVLPHYMGGATQVHLIFDKQNRQLFDPKMFERKRRDDNASTKKSHTCTPFTPNTQIPSKWMEYISCRTCKRSIVEAIGLSYLRNRLTQGQQVLMLAGCFSGEGEDVPVLISGDSLPQPTDNYSSNAEADICIWRHVQQVAATRILVYSPDSDVYNIGLGLFEEIRKDIIVQVNPISQDNKYVQLAQLSEALKRDPDIASLNSECLNRVMQTLFIVTGCDYISYVKLIGKKTFLDIFSSTPIL